MLTSAICVGRKAYSMRQCGELSVPGTSLCIEHTRHPSMPVPSCDHRFTVVVAWANDRASLARRAHIATRRATRIACSRCLEVREVPQ